MLSQSLRTSGKNLSVLILFAYPLFFILAWLQGLVTGAYGSRVSSDTLQTGAFYFLAYLVYVLLGGIIYEGLLRYCPPSWSTTKRRILAILLTVVVPVVPLVFGERLETLTEFGLPLLVALATYGALVTLPSIPAAHGD